MATPICFFSHFDESSGIKCGQIRKSNADTWSLMRYETLLENPPILSQNFKVYNETNISSELELILWRANKEEFTATECSSWLICPAHVEQLGNGWRTGKKKCQVQSGGKKCQKSPNQGISSGMLQQLKKSGQFLQIGERKSSV